jgi:hypothetical protein
VTLFVLFSIVSLILSIGWIAVLLNYSHVFRKAETMNSPPIQAHFGPLVVGPFNLSDLFPIPSESVVLYKANFNFVNESGMLKIKVDIGNSGTSGTTLTQLYVGTSITTLVNQTILPVAIPSKAIAEIILDYNWTSAANYYFRAVSSSKQTFNWSEQSPAPEAGDHSGSQTQGVPFRIYPETVTVNVGETFSVDVVFENMPASPAAVGFQFTITWDSSVLKSVSMEDVVMHSVTPESEWDNIWVIKNTVANDSVEYAETWQSLPRAQEGGYFNPIAGNWTVARITFESLTAGTTTLHFKDVVCGGYDSTGNVVEIGLKTFDGNVTVT